MAKDRPAVASVQVSAQSKPFFRNTLVYKRLTEAIFDPLCPGDGGGGKHVMLLKGA